MKTIYSLIFIILLLISGVCSAQGNAARLKSEAMQHMQHGRYGEAIDLLNKYIAATPQTYYGLYLRGLCYEKRGQYDNAALDLRRAIKLTPKNKEVQQALWRVENAWKSNLNKKIEGHRREIAINPNKAVNYVEIGKCKKNLGLWDEAEHWYDEYLKREDPSSDEVIRYTEILAHNNHLAKGEKILRTYTGKHPDDQRLWSRYGYFLMWLGKYKPAITAFEQALRIKPYFKEAQDGLDQAKGKAYIYTYTDTTLRHRKAAPAPFEYKIDKYYKIVRKNPGDHQTRMLLAEELLDKNRIEEAYEQLNKLTEKYGDNEKFLKLLDKVTAARDSLFNVKVEEYRQKFERDSTDGEVAVKLAVSYSNISDYDNAIATLERYLSSDTDNNDYEAKYLYAKYLNWSNRFEEAIDQITQILNDRPDETKYQLLRAQIAVASAIDLELAEQILNGILEKEPKNLEVLITMAYLQVQKKDFPVAQKYLAEITEMDPDNKEIKSIQDLYDRAVSAAEEKKIFQILESAQIMVQEGRCDESVALYNEYLSKVGAATRGVMLEYTDVLIFCAKDYAKARSILDEMLAAEYDPGAAMLRGKLFIASGDSVNALKEFQRLTQEDSSNFEARLYLGEALHMNGEYGKASEVYEALLKETQDSARIALVKKNIGWLPVTGFKGFLTSFPNSVAFTPLFSYYSDNNNLDYSNAGGRLELGVFGGVAAGVTFQRGMLRGNLVNRNFNTEVTRNYTMLKFNLFLYFSKYVSVSGAYGMANYRNNKKSNTIEGTLLYNKPQKLIASLSYETYNSGLMLFSPQMYDLKIDADHFRLAGDYYGVNGLRLTGYYNYLTIKDGNKGNDLMLRAGRRFDREITGGYEYFLSNYQTKSNFYYTPQNFESHSIWADWDAQKSKEIAIVISGKVGYVPSSDFVVREISGTVEYRPYDILIVSGKFSAGGSYRYDTNYSYTSVYASVYLKMF